MDRKSCMRREGRMPVAARRRPESSGLYNPFPQRGNDLKGGIRSDWHRRTETGSPLTPRPAFLDSGLRRNGEREIPAFTGRLRAVSATYARPAAGMTTGVQEKQQRSKRVAMNKSPVIPAKAGIQWFM